MPMHVGVDLERALELVARRGPRRARRGRARAPRGSSSARSSRLERGDDQQDRVGAGGRRLVDLVGVDDEVLAQDRQLRRRARLAQVVERAAEVERLGEDRQRRGAAALVGRTIVGDGRALADLARRRRAALVLGDHRDARAASAPRRTAGPRAARASAASSRASGTRRGGARPRRASPRRCAPARSCAAPAHCVELRRAGRAPRRRRRVDRLLGGARRPPRALSARPADVDRGAGVEHREVARRAGLAGEDRAASSRRCRSGVPPATSSRRARGSPTSSGATA